MGQLSISQLKTTLPFFLFLSNCWLGRTQIWRLIFLFVLIEYFQEYGVFRPRSNPFPVKPVWTKKNGIHDEVQFERDHILENHVSNVNVEMVKIWIFLAVLRSFTLSLSFIKKHFVFFQIRGEIKVTTQCFQFRFSILNVIFISKVIWT